MHGVLIKFRVVVVVVGTDADVIDVGVDIDDDDDDGGGGGNVCCCCCCCCC